IQGYLKPEFDEKGELSSITGYAQDITILKAGEQKLQNKNAELLRSNEELEQFAYVASHDLKEPLRMVSSYTQLLSKKMEDKLDEEGREFVKYAVEGAKRMSALIDDLLEYSRVGRTEIRLEKVNCNNIIKEVLHQLRYKIVACNADIQYGDMPEVNALPSCLVQLFQNLLSNALKFRSEQPPIIRLNAVLEGNEYIFSISDNGIGIEERYFDRIFAIFQRLHDKNTFEGTGIGLAVCKKIVEVHGGRIWVESKVGKGSTFYFSIGC
nr:ATP-binding protein [Bacteroidota bacterium]